MEHVHEHGQMHCIDLKVEHCHTILGPYVPQDTVPYLMMHVLPGPTQFSTSQLMFSAPLLPLLTLKGCYMVTRWLRLTSPTWLLFSCQLIPHCPTPV